MGVMVEDFKASPKREFRSKKLFSRASLLEVLAQGGTIASYTAQDGSVRMKILVKKQDLKKIIMNNSSSISSPSPSPSPSPSIERRLFDLMRKKANSNKAQVKGRNSCSSWKPVLQSIPEEH